VWGGRRGPRGGPAADQRAGSCGYRTPYSPTWVVTGASIDVGVGTNRVTIALTALPERESGRRSGRCWLICLTRLLRHLSVHDPSRRTGVVRPRPDWAVLRSNGDLAGATM
jgi:hypothetical protein